MSDAETRLALRMLAGSILNRFRIVFATGDVDTDVTTETPLPVTIVSGSAAAAPVALTNRSGTIAAAGVAQVLAVANPARRGLWVQNNSAGDLRLNSTAAASATAGILIPGGQNALYEYPAAGVPLTAISIWGATLGQAFESREW
jgi:hypothetical protein